MSGDVVRHWSDELARDPGSMVFMPLADELRRRSKLDEALAVALRGVERHPFVAGAHDVVARIFAQQGDDSRAKREWELALELDPSHVGSLKGLGFLSYRTGDLLNAQRFLEAAWAAEPGDRGVIAALGKLTDRLNGDSSVPNGTGNGHSPRTPAALSPPAVSSTAAGEARTLFASLLGDADRTALLLDHDGLVLAGSCVDSSGSDVGDEIGAVMSGVGEESRRALAHLGLGAWRTMLVEARHATVALAPLENGGIVIVAAARDTNVGLVKHLLTRALRCASQWLGVEK